MKLENYEVHLPNYSIGDKIYDKIGPVCESYGKKVLVIGGRKALDASYDKIRSYVEQTNLEIIGREIYGENCTYETVEKLRAMPLYQDVSVGRFSPFRVGLKTPISVNLKSPMHHVCY